MAVAGGGARVRMLERQVAYRATHDTLTGLANQTRFEEELKERLAGPTGLSVLVVEISTGADSDAGGQGAGEPSGTSNPPGPPGGGLVSDKVRVVVAQRLRRCLRDRDLVARIAHDTFGVLAASSDGVDQALRMAGRMMQTVGACISIDGTSVVTAIGVGVTIAEAGDDVHDVLQRARRALDQARAAGHNAIEVVRPSRSVTR